jgi:hypothetical protein
MEKELENSEKKKGESSPNQPSRPSQAARSRRLTGGPHLSAAVLPRVRPPSLTRCPVGPACRRQFHSPVRSLSLSRKPGSPAAEPLPRAPLSSLSASWTLRVSSAPSALAVDWRVRTRARCWISRPRCPPTRPAPFLEPTSAPRTPLASFRVASPSLALCPRRQPPLETRALVPGHLAHRRPL